MLAAQRRELTRQAVRDERVTGVVEIEQRFDVSEIATGAGDDVADVVAVVEAGVGVVRT